MSNIERGKYELVKGTTLTCSKKQNEELYKCGIGSPEKKINDVGHLSIDGNIIDEDISIYGRNPKGENYLTTWLKEPKTCAVFFDFDEAYNTIHCGDKETIKTMSHVYNMSEEEIDELIKDMESLF